MPPRFLSEAERQNLNEFPTNIETHDILSHFFLSPSDLEQIALQRGDHNRLGFALLLCSLRYLGFFPNNLQLTPVNAVDYLAEQLKLSAQALENYGQRDQTRREHQQVIMTYLGFRGLQAADESDLFNWLSQRALENPRPSVLLQQGSEWLYKQRLVRPSITTLERWVISARQIADEYSYQVLAASLNESTRQSLDKLLVSDTVRGESLLNWLRRPAQGYNAENILDALAKLERLQAWALDSWGTIPQNTIFAPPSRCSLDSAVFAKPLKYCVLPGRSPCTRRSHTLKCPMRVEGVGCLPYSHSIPPIPPFWR